MDAASIMPMVGSFAHNFSMADINCCPGCQCPNQPAPVPGSGAGYCPMPVPGQGGGGCPGGNCPTPAPISGGGGYPDPIYSGGGGHHGHTIGDHSDNPYHAPGESGGEHGPHHGGGHEPVHGGGGDCPGGNCPGVGGDLSIDLGSTFGDFNLGSTDFLNDLELPESSLPTLPFSS